MVLEAHSFPQFASSVCFSEEIMSADKYPSMFYRQMEAIVYILIQNGGYWLFK